jgi:hypothetical protein
VLDAILEALVRLCQGTGAALVQLWRACLPGLRQLPELAVLAAVLAIAALISYLHLRSVWQHVESPMPWLGPLLVDGLFAAAWLRMRRRRTAGHSVGPLAWLALGLALLATLAGNLAAAVIAGHLEPLALVVAAWPAVAFALVWELLTGHGARPASEAGGRRWRRLRDLFRSQEPPATAADELELLRQARVLAEAGAGRTRLMQLGLRERQARDLIDSVRQGRQSEAS